MHQYLLAISLLASVSATLPRYAPIAALKMGTQPPEQKLVVLRVIPTKQDEKTILHVPEDGQTTVEVEIRNTSKSVVYFFPENITVIAKTPESEARKSPFFPVLGDDLLQGLIREGYLLWPVEDFHGAWPLESRPHKTKKLDTKQLIYSLGATALIPGAYMGRQVDLKDLTLYPFEEVIAVYYLSEKDEMLAKRKDFYGVAMRSGSIHSLPLRVHMPSGWMEQWKELIEILGEDTSKADHGSAHPE